jgi:signal transduction histidine kinase
LPDCEQRDLFELFERGGGHTETPGAGIGLSVCRRIIERQGGRIWCDERPGGGAEFHFTVPDPQLETEPGNPAGTRFDTAASL